MTGPAVKGLKQDLEAAGFFCLGGFEPDAGHDVPPLPSGRPVHSLLLIGSTGPTIWPRLTQSPEYTDRRPDPLDRYTRRVLTGLADAHGFQPLFPFDGPPYYPFQQWAMKCGGFSQSPLGVLAHRDFGPWAGFRAVFLSAAHVSGGSSETGPCEDCADKPCLTACPVDAISLKDGYRVAECRAHLASGAGLECRSGCLARRACPVGKDHRQNAETARFHMDSFMGLC